MYKSDKVNTSKLKPNTAVEAYIKVKKTGCPVAESASIVGGKVSLFFLRAGTRTSVHRVEFRTKSISLDDLRRKSITLAKLGEKKILVESESCLVCKEFADSQILVMNAEQVSEKDMLYHVLSFSSSALNSFMRNLKKKGIVARLILKNKYTENAALTPKQLEALSFAFKNGFFDVNRKTTMTELAYQLGVSPPSLQEKMRRGIRKIIEAYLNQIHD